MDAEFVVLEDKVGQLARLCQQLRGENRALRQQLLTLQQENHQLKSKVEGAKERVTAILSRLPEDEE